MKVMFGKSIVNGQLRHASASSVQLAQNCLRAYAYDKVEGLRAPSSQGQIVGTAYHQEVSTYHQDGDVAKLSARLQALLGEFPAQQTHPHTFVDVPLVPSPDVPGPLKVGAPFIESIPFVGEIDLLTLPQGDEPIEITDYKFVKDFTYALTPFELARHVQPTIYAFWTRAPIVKVTYAYVRTKGPHAIKRVSATVTQARIQQNVDELIIPTLNLMKAVATAGKVDLVPGNQKFCGSYGGCAHRSYCPFANQEYLTQHFGENPVNFQMPATPGHDPHRAAIDAAKQKLAAAENPAATQAAPVPAAYAQPATQPSGRVQRLLAVLATAPNGGRPGLGHNLALECAHESGFAIESNPPWLGGAGALSAYTLSTFEELETMARTLAPAAFAPTSVASAPTFNALPTMTIQTQFPAQISAASAPTFGALPTAAMPAQAIPAPQADPYPHLPAIVPPDAPGPSWHPGMQAPVVTAPAVPLPTLAPALAAPPAPKAGRGRPAKVKATPIVDGAQVLAPAQLPPPQAPPQQAPQQAVLHQATPAVAPMPQPTTIASPVGGLQLFVNCMAEPVIAQNLREYVTALVTSIQTHYNVTDLRNVTTKDHVLGYGGWRGILTSVARANPPQGAFYVDVRGDELAEAVVQGLRSVATLYVRGN